MIDGDFFRRSVRSCCSECGWARIDWMSAEEARAALPDFDEAEAMVGRVEAAWRCPACGEVGFFGPLESDVG